MSDGMIFLETHLPFQPFGLDENQLLGKPFPSDSKLYNLSDIYWAILMNVKHNIIAFESKSKESFTDRDLLNKNQYYD